MKNGLKLEQEFGANPYKFGMIGSTDSHSGLASNEEDNFWGKMARDSTPETKRSDDRIGGRKTTGWNMSASGLAAVWSEENTREAIFSAFQRKEVYATTGTRMRVRVFGGWEFSRADLDSPDFAAIGYSQGVPMGGDLRNSPSGSAPTFLVRALRDPDGANLDRVQIIKGWLDDKGETHERIYDVAVSGDRKIGSDGRCKTPVGTTVDIEKATYTNTIGEAVLTAFWEDPDFDPQYLDLTIFMELKDASVFLGDNSEGFPAGFGIS